jgi:chromosome segregation ATPase
MTADVDRKLGEQLARRSELDMLKSECDGILAHMLDAQQKIEGVASLQARVLPIGDRLTELQDQLGKAEASFKEVQREDAVIDEQQTRLAELVEASRALAADTAERMKQMQALGEELGRATAVKDELVAELARVQVRQRDAVTQAEAAEDQVKRAEAMFKQLDQRRTQLAFSEKKIGAVEAKMSDLAQRSNDIDQKMKVLTEREAVVSAVKAEVENVYQISAKSKADLQYVTDHREEVAALRRQVQELLGKASETEAKIAAIEAKRKTVDEVQTKTSLISNLLEDVRINLDTLGEQKAVVDHVSEKLARLDFMMQEAQNTLRTLQHERELAERIEQSIKQLRSRTAKTEDTVKSASA